MKPSYTILIFIFFTTCAFKCVKPDDGIGGKGGEAYITLMPKHNGTSKNLVDCKMYIKYNATAAPAGNIYDDSITCTREDTISYAYFSNIKRGNYFFHCVGYDNSISKPVTGDLQFTITKNYDNTYNMAVID